MAQIISIRWQQPVASQVIVYTNYGEIMTSAGATVSTWNLTLGPGQTMDNIVINSISPSSDSQYSYHVLFPVTLESGQYYPEVAQYLMNKYGQNYGTKRSPLPIEETIILGSSFASDIGTGVVKYISTDNTWDSSVSLKLYLEDHTSTYYCVTLDTSGGGDLGRTNTYFYD